MTMQVKFWGVRGSIPTPVAANLGFGGNTACVEVTCGDERLIIDGGSGVRQLGLDLQKGLEGKPGDFTFLMTHFHWDHIQGLPYFAPIYVPSNRLTFYAGCDAQMCEQTLETQLAPPYFPVCVAATRDYQPALAGSTVRIGCFTVRPFEMFHPQPSVGYRIEANGSVYVHASDFEHGDACLDRTLREYAQDADVLLMDSQYTPREYDSRKGWGHSTWSEAVNVARESRVKQLILFHHDPAHSDETMRSIEHEAQRHFKNTVAAREGMVIPVS